MRIWDVSPGYLDRQRLLGEHRELHGLHSILVNGKSGYSQHPETLRWVGCVPALCRRHDTLVAEMRLRGYTDRTPVTRARGPVRWPAAFVTIPGDQLALLENKQRGREAGRIPLPRTVQELWAQHKYSVMARSQESYRSLGRRVARTRRGAALGTVLAELVELLHAPPAPGGLANALEHMWGYVAGVATPDDRRAAFKSRAAMFAKICRLALRARQPYLMSSTALSDLAPFAGPVAGSTG